MLSASEQQSISPTIDDVIAAVEQYHPKADFALIRHAYAFGAEAHKEQKRLSSVPYISHPLAVAHILTQLKMDAMTIASALLHDTIEDTGVTAQQVTERFGNDVAVLVEGVTKLSKLEFASREERQAESFRKMVVAMAKYIREPKQRAIAQETLDIYAPLAHRLGIAWIQSELEDLSFCYVNPRAYYDIQTKLTSTQEARARYLARMQEIIARELEQIHVPSTISGRPKHLYSIYQKMQRQQLTFEEIHDILAVRVITDTVRNCYAALGMLHALWKPIPGRFKDYIALPKPNMYQSLHTTVVGPDGERVELQIRTEEMHRIAEEGIAAHWRYKEQTPSEKHDEWFGWLRRLLEWQQDVQDPIEFMEMVKIEIFPE